MFKFPNPQFPFSTLNPSTKFNFLASFLLINIIFIEREERMRNTSLQQGACYWNTNESQFSLHHSIENFVGAFQS